MADTVKPETRTRMMSQIRSKNTAPELAVRRFLHRCGFRYRVHVRTLPGSPDIVLPGRHAAIFVNGCFWHRHPGCRYAYSPKSRVEFWEAKFRANVQRDARARTDLEAREWTVLTVWECEIDQEHLIELVTSLERAGRDPQGR